MDQGGLEKSMRVIWVLLLAAGLTVLPRVSAHAVPREMMRLAEVLGAVHYLRPLCGSHEGQKWRNQMIRMLDAVHTSGDERQVLISHFNIFYYRYRDAYPRCTGSAARDANRLVSEGQRLAEALARRGYGR
ncbi:MAG: TIGR02301 family protein [Parvibaculum sp.]|nr:TIGR02301 family protein [Parvibaculum sp.]